MAEFLLGSMSALLSNTHRCVAPSDDEAVLHMRTDSNLIYIELRNKFTPQSDQLILDELSFRWNSSVDALPSLQGSLEASPVGGRIVRRAPLFVI
jgi:hypothetical protein